MIKLFWNTHNQSLPNSENKKERKIEKENYGWGIYHKNSSDKWIYEILKKVKYTTIASETELEKDDTLIIIDSSVEKKRDFYSKINMVCSKIFLFHLGDETGIHDLSEVYNNCSHIWRAFYLNKYFKNSKVDCLPIGYKTGILNKKKSDKKFKWAFTGTPHKSSRHDLLFQLSEIKPFYCHKTEKFDVKIISVNEMSEILSSTEFLPCPNGFFHPETYRLYEALECECIPIVENAYKYYDRLFPGNPFIKVDKWIDAKNIIKNWKLDKIKNKQIECRDWWKNYKTNLQNLIRDKIS
jgi:hypothetical protein